MSTNESQARDAELQDVQPQPRAAAPQKKESCLEEVVDTAADIVDVAVGADDILHLVAAGVRSAGSSMKSVAGAALELAGEAASSAVESAGEAGCAVAEVAAGAVGVVADVVASLLD